MPSYQVPTDYTGQSAKEFLRHRAGISLTLWRKIKKQNDFYINEVQTSPGLATIKPGDVIRYTLEQTSSIEPVALPLEICYEDAEILVINKPAGQLVHPTTKEHATTLGNGVLHYYKENSLPFSFHPVHRLDKNTSGLVLIAKLPQIQHQLSTKDKMFHRSYQAIIKGSLTPASGEINAPIARKEGSIIERTVAENGQPSLTYFKTLQKNDHFSLLELELATGRTHQIRVHMAHIGHPLLGDDLYGETSDYISRQALHAFSLEFIQPTTQKTIRVSCPLPDDMSRVLSLFPMY